MTNASVPNVSAPTDGLFVVASAPAGWYEIGNSTRRWFDGRGWTDHYVPVLTLVPDCDPVKTHHVTNHGFHLVMTIMTLSAWIPVWAAVVVFNIIRSTAPDDTRGLSR